MENKNNKTKQYQSILNNLLDVNPSDQAIFTKVNNKYCFDFYSLFGPEAFDLIYSNKNFDIPILEVNLIRVCQLLEKSNDYDETIAILEENNYELSTQRLNQLKKDFHVTKNKIINEIRANFQRQSLKWKLFLNKANEINAETNIWPMHLGFLFVQVSIDGKSVYAPLFFKEVYLEIRNARPFLISNGDIKPNEKLLFLLNNAGFDLEVTDNYGDWSIKELIKNLHELWGQIYEFKVNLNSSFNSLSAEEIINESLQFAGGVVLGLFQPSGGYIRNRMLEIINNNELNKILQVEFNKNIYKKRINDILFNPKTSLFKIAATNYSQDRAIASALNQNTIIWGPPGTGKSQTIVNILTNVLVYSKTAIVCSQKKAALEVIRNRMGILKIFCLFMLNSKNMNKKSFYEPIKEYLDYLENYEEVDNLKPLRIITNDEINFVNNIQMISNDKRFNHALSLINPIHKAGSSLTNELWEKIINLPDSIKYPMKFKFSSAWELRKFMLKDNNLSFKIHKKNYWLISKLSRQLFDEFNNFTGNLDEIVRLKKKLTPSDFDYIKSLANILPNYDNEQTSDQYELKRFITKNIINSIMQFNDDEKAEYTEFAATARLAIIEPYKFMKRFPNMIKKLFPIIIVTPEADLSAWNKGELDYGILDESSQIFIEKGLPVLYLSKIKVLAGDDQQMKPSNWFGVRVSDEETIFGKVDSMLDFAKGVGVYNILLDKNYRSNYASLMTFSSKYFYNSSLDVIDNNLNKKNYHSIEVIDANGAWEDNKNEIEANLAIKIAKENLDKYEKIILLCFNAKQQDYITTKIFRQESNLENAIIEGKLLLRNIENIQGDEADLVIASIAYDSSVLFHSTYVGHPGGKNALNVAISRAKDKMIVLKSLNSSDVSVLTGNEDVYVFKKWLEFLELDSKEKQEFVSNDNFAQSELNIGIEVKKPEFEIELENSINELIKDYDSMTLASNESIGTLKIDYILKHDNKNIMCFIIDNYEYQNDIEKYILQKDLYKFIKSKKYNIYLVNSLSWATTKDKIYDEIIHYIENSVVNNNEFTDNYDNELFDEKSYKTSEFASSNNLNNYVSQTYTLEAEQISQNNNTSNISLDSSELSNDDLDNKDKLANDESFEENVKKWEQILSRETIINTAIIDLKD
ncbi:DNA2/NAM7 family helicase [Mycoplasmopsis agalactiae]|uniref:DEAD/DEAH box helicase n=1 Tax=Mycoplasmopsis agalactiae TaxID=2110 RepID=UPI001FA4455C|nr:DEAD/DEAH box helicase [Mycoplasmopsis agalactiae]MCE6061736.1 DNA2/NAM7 family helicase [Mycoplasmopsis agalactiae]